MVSLREEMSIKNKLKTNCVADSFGQRAYINILTQRQGPSLACHTSLITVLWEFYA